MLAIGTRATAVCGFTGLRGASAQIGLQDRPLHDLAWPGSGEAGKDLLVHEGGSASFPMMWRAAR